MEHHRQAEPWFREFIATSQLLAGSVIDGDPGQVLEQIRSLVAAVPSTALPREQVIVRDVATRMICHLGHVSQQPKSVGAVVELLKAGSFLEWKTRFADSAILPSNAFKISALPLRVRMALSLMDRHFNDSMLNLDRVARACNLSKCHLVRLLQKHTGMGFVRHMKQRRIALARSLLSNSALSIKEIAARCGYDHVRQLERDSKELLGQSPTQFRDVPGL
jgi:transcriptional regulator GlxA family with amidase domain